MSPGCSSSSSSVFVSGISRRLETPRYGCRASLSSYAPSPSSPALSPTVCIHLFCTRPSILSSVSLSSFVKVSLSSSLSSLRALLPSSPRDHIPFQSSLRYPFFRCLRCFRRSSNVFVPDLALPGHPAAHPSRHPHLLNPCFLSLGGGPCFRSI